MLLAAKKRRLLLATAGLLGLPFATVGPVSAQAIERITVTGSSTVAPLVLEIAKRFERGNPAVRIDVQTGGSSRGVADTRSGVAHIGMASRRLSATEADLKSTTIALDGIGLIVHRSNPIQSLSDEQIRAVFTGQLRDWSMVDSRFSGPISIVNKAEGRSTLDLFLQHFGLKNSQIKAHVVIGDNQQGIKTVAANPGAIGYVSIGTAATAARLGAAIRLLPLRGVPASVEELRSGRYPLARELNLLTRGAPSATVARFIAFTRAREVADLVAAQSFVTPGPRE